MRRETGLVLPAARETALRAALERAAPGLGVASFVPGHVRSGGRPRSAGPADRRSDQPGNVLRPGPRAARRDPVACPAPAGPRGRLGNRPCLVRRLRERRRGLHAGPAGRAGVRSCAGAGGRAGNGHLTGCARRRGGWPVPGARGARAGAVPAPPLFPSGARRQLCHQRSPAPPGALPPAQPRRDACPPPGEASFDLITCRNVLIYFSAPLVSTVIDSLERSLRPGGMLVLGAADALHRLDRPPARQRPASRPAQRPASRAAAAPPAARGPSLSREQRLAAALEAADHGDREDALAHVASLLAITPLDADAHFIQGLVTLESGDPAAAAVALRRALCTDARFALARSLSAAPMTHSATRRPPGERTSRLCARWTRRTTGTSGCSSRSISATSPPHAGPACVISAKDPDGGPSMSVTSCNHVM